MRILLVFALAACVVDAHAAPIDPRTNVASFTTENIVVAAQAVNFQTEILSDGTNKAVGITAANGAKFIAQPTTCQKPNQVDCYALSLYGIFRGWQPTLQQVNYFNKHRSFTKAYLDETEAVLARYEIADYGIPLGNISSNIANFAAVANQFQQFLDSGGAGAAYTPSPDTHILGSAFGSTPRTVNIGELEIAPRYPAYINNRGR